jgi:hypothetical protein
MSYFLVLLSALMLVVPATLRADVNIGIGIPAPPFSPAPLPRVVVSSPPEVLFDAPPLFLAPSQLGFYVAADTKYDIMYAQELYYLHYGSGWYRSRHYNGPWVRISYNDLPYPVRKHKLDYIRSHRDSEYRVYYRDRDRYRGDHFRGTWQERRGEHIREEHRSEREEWREERRDNRDYYRDR